MGAKKAIIDRSREWQVVEEVCEQLPHVGIPIFSNALIVETVHLSDLARFVVATQDRHALRIAHLQRDHDGDTLDAVIASVNVVTHKQIVCVRRMTSYTKQLEQVMELAMDIAHNGDRRSHRPHISVS